MQMRLAFANFMATLLSGYRSCIVPSEDGGDTSAGGGGAVRLDFDFEGFIEGAQELQPEMQVAWPHAPPTAAAPALALVASIPVPPPALPPARSPVGSYVRSRGGAVSTPLRYLSLTRRAPAAPARTRR